MSDDTPAAIMATTGKLSTLADGTLRIVVEIPPKDASNAFAMFAAPGTPVALARITPEASIGELRKEAIAGAKGQHGDAYTLLYKSGFWFAGPLHEALGIAGEIAHMREKNTPAPEITEFVKGALYDQFGVESMSTVAPSEFRAWARMHKIEHILPSDF